MISVSIQEAGHSFGALIHRVRRSGERVDVEDAGRLVARIVPAHEARTGAQLAKEWPALPHLDPDEAALFESDLLTARTALKPVSSTWD